MKNIGIDLGTTNCCISYLEGSEAVIIPNPEGSRVIPSIIALNRDKKRIFGNIAKRQFITNNENTIWGVKRIIGRKFDSNEVKSMLQRVNYSIIEAENGDAKILFGGKAFSPEELSGMLLGYLKQIAEDYLGEEIGDTVITVPAFFNDSQRQATKVAGEIAGLKVTRIINEPTAALIAYKKRIPKDGLYAVYDLGGGTFDISIVEVRDDIYKVLSTTGDTFLGGTDFDEKVIEWILEEFKKDTSIDIFNDKNSFQRVIQAAEKAKIELSFNQETEIAISYFYHFANGDNYHFQKKLSRAQLEHDTEQIIDRTIRLVKKSLDEISIAPGQIERVILVGGQSRMPLVAKKVEEFFNKEAFINLNPEEVVAQGAAVQSEIIKGKVKDILLLDVTSLSLGVETKGDTFTKVIERNSTIPIKKSMRFTTITDNQQTVTIHVMQGERELASHNKSLGHFNLVGIPMAPKGVPQIDVTFEIDANGIVRVSAKDVKTNLVQSMKIQPASGMSPEEIAQRIREADEYNKQDKQAIQCKKIKLQLKEEMETVRFFFQRHSAKLDEKGKNEIKNVIERTEKVLEEGNLDTFQTQLNRIQTLRNKINNLLISEFEQ
ncbi:MAG: molecular chaperone DnaK [Acidobacteria bacterium]|jgi:molecular chaperone DnaK|nr:molecular chaperone DnaK [Acidobacteriota bacterium]